MSFNQFDPVLLDALVKASILLAGAAAASLFLSRASAASRHLVWTFALSGALALPMLSYGLPRWPLPIVTLTSSSPQPVGEVAAPAPAQIRRAPTEPAAASAVRSTPVHSAPAREWSASALLVAIWAAGATLVLGRLLLGLAAVQWMTRRKAHHVVNAPWLPLAVELASDLEIAHRVRFLESRAATMPMAFGIFRPAVVMPADAGRWPLERLRIVLLHELAHVKRRDCLTHAIAQLACALYWFNPLVWIAARHIRIERERACDDLVLSTGTRGPDYAEELLEIARVMRGGRFPALMTGATLAMAHRTQLEGRLIAILDPRTRRSGVSRLRTLAAGAALACALPPLAAVQPWVVAASPAAEAEHQEPPSAGVAPVSGVRPAPTPTPMPEPRPAESGRAADNTTDLAQSAARGVVAQSVVQELARAAQVELQSVVQGAVRGVAEGVASAVEQQTTEGRTGADPRTVAALTAALKDPDKEVRETAMHALVQMRDPSIFEPLVQALKDESADVREQAVHALGQLRDKRAVDPVLGMLKDQNASVREQAAFALGQLRDPRAVDALMAAVKDASPSVREQAVFALGQLRDKRATPALNDAVKDADAGVREQAVFALGQIRDVSAIDGLIGALRDVKPDVRQQAAFALGQIRDARSVEPLISALKDSNADVREQAAFGLGQLRDRAAVEALVIAVKDTDADVREQVVFALGQIRDPRAIDALTTALKDASADVRQQAAFALGQIAR